VSWRRLFYWAAFLVLASTVSAVPECPPGFEWRPMSGVGCVQMDCFDMGGVWSYTQACICIEGYTPCMEDVDYTSFDRERCTKNCPAKRLIACVITGSLCPGEDEIIEEGGEDAEPVLTPMKDGKPDNEVYYAKEEEDCSDYCGKQNPPREALGGYTYPNCKCKCDDFEGWVIPIGCKKCHDICTKPQMGLNEWRGGECSCFCHDPLKKWDSFTASCVDGANCNDNGVCEVRLDENCKCGDCSCEFEGKDNAFMNDHVKCDPGNPKAHGLGCVYEEIDDEELLKVLQKEWQECTTAWVFKAMGSQGEYGQDTRHKNINYRKSSSAATATNRIPGSQMKWENMDIVGKWMAKSGCLSGPTGDDRIVPGRQDATADPAVCIAEYCQATIAVPFERIANRVREKTGKIYNPTVSELAEYWWNRIKPSGGFKALLPKSDPDAKPMTPKQHYQILGGNYVNAFGNGKYYANGQGYASASNRNIMAIPKSEYMFELTDDTTEYYLFDGGMTIYFFGEEDIEALTLQPGEKAVFDANAQTVDKTAFNKADLTDWWTDTPYLDIGCPPKSHMEGPDCVCDIGYAPDLASGQCVKEESRLKLPEVDDTTLLLVGGGIAGLSVLALAAAFVFLIIVVVAVAVWRKRKRR
jgi:hypothetical protein